MGAWPLFSQFKQSDIILLTSWKQHFFFSFSILNPGILTWLRALNNPLPFRFQTGRLTVVVLFATSNRRSHWQNVGETDKFCPEGTILLVVRFSFFLASSFLQYLEGNSMTCFIFSVPNSSFPPSPGGFHFLVLFLRSPYFLIPLLVCLLELFLFLQVEVSALSRTLLFWSHFHFLCFYNRLSLCSRIVNFLT